MADFTEIAPGLSYLNREAVLAAERASCFQCLRVFPSVEITKWIDRDRTAVCPHCGIDSILPGEVDQKTLAQLNDRWFLDPVY